MGRAGLLACVAAFAATLAATAQSASVPPPAPALAPDAAAGHAAIPAILVSRQLMTRENLRVGDVVRLSADVSGHAAREFRIAGTYEPLPDPMQFAQPVLEVRMHLPDLLAFDGRQAGQGPAAISSINVDVRPPPGAPDGDGPHVDALAAAIEARFPGTVARSTRAPNTRTSTFLVIERFHTAVAIVTMVGSGLFLLALMVMLVDERREAVGTLRLVGLTRGRILRQLLIEGAVMAVAGTAAGLLFALATEGAFNRFFQWRYDTTLVFLRLTPEVLAQSALLALPLGIGASLIASWPLLRTAPLGLMRR